jgi:fucose permease
MSATFFAALLYLPQFMQKILDYSPLEAGLGLLPMMATFAVVSFAAGSLYNRFGAKLISSVGALCLCVGLLLISMIDEGSGYSALLPGMFVLGIGVGTFYSSVTTAGITALDPSRSSLAGGIVYMCQIAGGAVGLGLTTSIFTSASQDKLSDAVSGAQHPLSGADLDAVQGVLAGTGSAGQVLEKFPGIGAELVELVRASFAEGMQVAFRVDAALAFCGFIVCMLFVGGSVFKRNRTASPDS